MPTPWKENFEVPFERVERDQTWGHELRIVESSVEASLASLFHVFSSALVVAPLLVQQKQFVGAACAARKWLPLRLAAFWWDCLEPPPLPEDPWPSLMSCLGTWSVLEQELVGNRLTRVLWFLRWLKELLSQDFDDLTHLGFSWFPHVSDQGEIPQTQTA